MGRPHRPPPLNHTACDSESHAFPSPLSPIPVEQKDVSTKLVLYRPRSKPTICLSLMSGAIACSVPLIGFASKT